MGGGLEVGEEGEGEEHLGEMVHLEVGVWVWDWSLALKMTGKRCGRGRTKSVDGYVVFTYAFTGIADKLGLVSIPMKATARVWILLHRSASRSSIALQLHPSFSSPSDRIGRNALCWYPHTFSTLPWLLLHAALSARPI